MRRLFLSILAVIAFSTSAQANDFAVAVGFRSNSADSTTYSYSATTSFQAGVLGFWDFTDVLGVRSGFIYAQRNFDASGTPANEVKMGYFDIPVALTVKISDYARFFVGPVFALNVSKKSSVPTTVKPEGANVGLQLGASFKFAPQFGGELYYEMLPGRIWSDDLKDAKTVGANLLVTFE